MTFYFFDLETTGLDPRSQRIVQFAGQRTNSQLEPLGEPHNFLLKVPKDVLPSAETTFITGITPQAANRDGLTEAEFLHIFHKEIATANTCTLGFNTMRFDSDFIRFTNYRNFYDPYEWEWRDGRSKWDLLDVLRMTSALRPGEIKWPRSQEGKPSYKLEDFAKANGLSHIKAHDAMSDVIATIEAARVVHQAQPKLWDYLLDLRDKNKVRELLNLDSPRVLVHSSGQLSSEFLATTLVYPICTPKKDTVYVYDLRFDPTPFIDLSAEELSKKLFLSREEAESNPRLPVKGVHLNKSPALAPVSVLDADSEARIGLSLQQAESNLKVLKNAPDFGDRLLRALELSAREHDKEPKAVLPEYHQ